MTGQHTVGTKERWGLARFLRRIVPELQKNVELFNEVRRAPWEAEPREGSDPSKVLVAPSSQVPPGELPTEQPSMELQSLDVKIRRNVELHKFGFTQNCKGCYQAAIGGAVAKHTDASRLRTKNAMRAVPELSGRVKHFENHREEKEAKRQRAEVSPPNSGIPEA